MSSIYLYLKNEEVPKLVGYQIIDRHNKDGGNYKTYSIPGVDLSFDKGRFNTILHGIQESIPLLIKDIVEEISLYDWIPLDPERVIGRYKYKTAIALLDRQKDNYELRILGKLLEDVKELYFQIRSGNIQPFESWEKKQKFSILQKLHIIK
ncbi:MAG: hypothetical protein Q8N87_01490 [bacterium]|nr:hypothetical protein [bacterium]